MENDALVYKTAETQGMFSLKKRRKSYTIKMISIGKEELDMRVIAGKARRLPLVSPEGRGTRPTTDRIKETLFNILQDLSLIHI